MSAGRTSSDGVGQPTRLRLTVEGSVQGVGFRPYVYRLARELDLGGWVRNSSEGVVLEIEGAPERLDTFIERFAVELPPVAAIRHSRTTSVAPEGEQVFRVVPSDDTGSPSAYVLPDLGTCENCRREILDPSNRRYRYPFTNCTDCGPRYSIIHGLPYDRHRTTMASFTMCDQCRAEYEDPADRRFHAQPNACPMCGPHLELWEPGGDTLAEREDALLQACDAVRSGQIVALKGLGGFQLLVDGRNDEAVHRLRLRKAREGKPLALMMPSLEKVARHCAISPVERQLLQSAASPVVLLRRHAEDTSGIASLVAPGNPRLGVMLPYTPLHHLLMAELGFAVVATSGNRADEPICIDEREALARLADIADVFLVHNRPIARQVDDSVVRVMVDRPVVIRNARGYAPTTVEIGSSVGAACIGVGAHLKNAVAIAHNGRVYLSQHIGDLDTRQAHEAHHRVTQSLAKIYDFQPAIVAADLHPDYFSTHFARDTGLPVCHVQHHYAHVLACLAEHGLDGPALGITWDGTGYGEDGTVWGGEFLRITDVSFKRVAHLRTFGLPGGEQAVRQPWRCAVGVLYEIFGEQVVREAAAIPALADLTAKHGSNLVRMLQQGLNCPVTSSAGRLFDAVSALLGICGVTRYEGQAAMMLEYAIDGHTDEQGFAFDVAEANGIVVVDWQPTVRDILEQIDQRVAPGLISARFHNTLVEMMVTVARRIGEQRVVLTGGCFQNGYLAERATERLGAEGFEVIRHERVPPNDGGLALGQIMAAIRQQRKSDEHVSGDTRKDSQY